MGHISIYLISNFRVERIPWLLYDYTVDSSYADNVQVLEEEIEQFYTFERGLNTSTLDIQVRFN